MDDRQRLSNCREEVDKIDKKLVELLVQRAEQAEIIAAAKRRLGLPIRDPEREKQVYEKLVANNPGPLSAEAVKRIFSQIIEETFAHEQSLHGKDKR